MGTTCVEIGWEGDNFTGTGLQLHAVNFLIPAFRPRLSASYSSGITHCPPVCMLSELLHSWNLEIELFQQLPPRLAGVIFSLCLCVCLSEGYLKICRRMLFFFKRWYVKWLVIRFWWSKSRSGCRNLLRNLYHCEVVPVVRISQDQLPLGKFAAQCVVIALTVCLCVGLLPR